MLLKYMLALVDSLYHWQLDYAESFSQSQSLQHIRLNHCQGDLENPTEQWHSREVGPDILTTVSQSSQRKREDFAQLLKEYVPSLRIVDFLPQMNFARL